ncbi:hypothetical protein [Pigmentiphaga sp. CHJ604]|uniref:hypothetical protein n=1 Tax=Pigmentiphaga sp. CHJ604 TaxID=3081984 RepID=UPI0030CD2101
MLNTRVVLTFLAVATLAGYFIKASDSPQELVSVADRATTSASGTSARRSAKSVSLEMDRPPLEDAATDPFSLPAPVAPVAETSTPPPPPPTAPPMPFRYFGRVTGFDGVAVTYLMRDNDLIAVSAGDILDGTYRIESVEMRGVVIVYQPLSVRTELLAPDGGAP